VGARYGATSRRAAKATEVIRRGDIWMIDLEPVRAGELGKVRPCMVVSDDSYNRHAAALLIMPITSYPATTRSPEIGAGRQTGLSDSSSVLPLHIRAVARDRFVRPIGRVPEFVIEQAIEILSTVVHGT